jgi:hypothetical protein
MWRSIVFFMHLICGKTMQLLNYSVLSKAELYAKYKMLLSKPCAGRFLCLGKYFWQNLADGQHWPVDNRGRFFSQSSS